MAHETTSDDIANKAGEIMAIARRGGPIRVHQRELRAAFAETGGGSNAVLAKVDAVLRSYFDAAESVAASALTQRVKP